MYVYNLGYCVVQKNAYNTVSQLDSIKNKFKKKEKALKSQ